MAGIIERGKNLQYTVKHQRGSIRISRNLYIFKYLFIFLQPAPLGLQERFSDALQKNLYLYIQWKKQTRCVSAVSLGGSHKRDRDKISSCKKEKLDYEIKNSCICSETIFIDKQKLVLPGCHKDVKQFNLYVGTISK